MVNMTEEDMTNTLIFTGAAFQKAHRQPNTPPYQKCSISIYDADMFARLRKAAEANGTDISSIAHQLMHILDTSILNMADQPAGGKQDIRTYIDSTEKRPPMKPPRLDATTSEILEYLSTIKTAEQYDTDVERPLRALIRACSTRHEEITRDAVWRE